MKHIFEPFYRADKEASREQGSAGLGLSLLLREQYGFWLRNPPAARKKRQDKKKCTYFKTFMRKGHVLFSVSNKGQQMSQEELKHIFEPFYRADKEASREQGPPDAPDAPWFPAEKPYTLHTREFRNPHEMPLCYAMGFIQDTPPYGTTTAVINLCCIFAI